jgi:hypothetical protein
MSLIPFPPFYFLEDRRLARAEELTLGFATLRHVKSLQPLHCYNWGAIGR